MLTDTNPAGRKVPLPAALRIRVRGDGALASPAVACGQSSDRAGDVQLTFPVFAVRLVDLVGWAALLDRAALPREAPAVRSLAALFGRAFGAGPIVLPLTSACWICSRPLTIRPRLRVRFRREAVSVLPTSPAPASPSGSAVVAAPASGHMR